MTTHVESFESLEWTVSTPPAKGATDQHRSDTGDGYVECWQAFDHSWTCCAGVLNRRPNEHRWSYDLPDLPTAKRAAWRLLLELRAKATPPVERDRCDFCSGRGGRDDPYTDQWYSCHHCCGTGFDGGTWEESEPKPAKLATNLPPPNPLTPAELAEAAAEGRACREALDRATVVMEGHGQVPTGYVFGEDGEMRIVRVPPPVDPRDAELEKLRAAIARVRYLVGMLRQPIDEPDDFRAGVALGREEGAQNIEAALGEYAREPA